MLGWSLASIIKVSEEELVFLSGIDDLATAACKLWHPDLRLLVVTRDKEGSRYITTAFSGVVPGFAVESVDTTGAGDGFVAGLRKGLLDHPDAPNDEAQLRAICRYANAVGALATMQRGAIPALPGAAQVEAFLSARSAERS